MSASQESGIQVLVRVRPPNEREKQTNRFCVEVDEAKKAVILARCKIRVLRHVCHGISLDFTCVHILTALYVCMSAVRTINGPNSSTTKLRAKMAHRRAFLSLSASPCARPCLRAITPQSLHTVRLVQAKRLR